MFSTRLSSTPRLGPEGSSPKSAHRHSQKRVCRPKNGPVPRWGVNGYPKLQKAWAGFEQTVDIFQYKPDAAYYGKTVGPSDKDKVLLRWKLDDGRYEVIFGDLHSETVTAERLRGLEGK